MQVLLGRRVKAYLRDCAGYLGIAAAMVPAGVLAYRAGWGVSPGMVLAMGTVPPLVATVVAAVRETSGGTPGKRAQDLTVISTDGRPLGLGRALVRNGMKIGLPWQLGHVVALGAASGGFERGQASTLVATALVYPYLATELVLAGTGAGRALHDRLAGTRVVHRVVTTSPAARHR